ncbi:MAG: sodium/solute symporter [Candidatus Erginobacter occultus]|nr:sodium/solute symporter [Candidatus Erginobacter occultus]
MTFAPLDYLVLLLYFSSIAAIGLLSGRKEKSTDDYFLGGRSMPWWAVTFSILATEVSAVTFIGAPGSSYGGDYTYLQFAFGSLLGRILIGLLLLPAFYRGQVTSIYQFLSQRFGEKSRRTAVIFFFITQLLAAGVRLLLVSLVLSVVTGFSLSLIIASVAAIALLYTLIGGIKAVIWTDFFQFFIFMGGAWLVIYFILDAIPGGWSGLKELAGPAKFRVFDFRLSLTASTVFLIAFINGCVQTFAALGTDQALTQRMLTCKNLRQSRWSLILTGVIDFPIVFTYLLIGTGLFALYEIVGPALPAEYAADPDLIFPHFIVTVLPPGVRGLLIASIFAAAMSSLDSSINALSSSAVMDIYRPFIRPGKTEKHYLAASRVFVAVFCLLLIGAALGLEKIPGGKLWLGFKVTGFTYGAMLGIFLLGVLTKKSNDRMNIYAMVTSPLLLVAFTLGEHFLFPGTTLLAWPWYVVVGTAWTFFWGWFFARKQVISIQ